MTTVRFGKMFSLAVIVLALALGCEADTVENAAAGGDPLVIVQDGQGRAVIVVAADDAHGREGAVGIQKYIEKMSGAKLDIVQEGAEVTGEQMPIQIYVGHTAAAANNGIDIPAGYDPSIRPDTYEEEGYVIKTTDNAIFIGGNSDGPYRGTVYGSYAFLEKLGCRFYFPGEWGEIIPQHKTIAVEQIDVESRPDFPLRQIGLNPGWVPTTAEDMAEYRSWCMKVGMQASLKGMYPGVGDGFLGWHLPPDEYFQEHPEYYAMDKSGKRHVPTTGDFMSHTMLCLSNPDVLAQVTKNLKDAFEGKRSGHRISETGLGISPPDGQPYCFCEKCAANSRNFEYSRYVWGNQMSEEYFEFASKLAEEFPDKYVATMAYQLRVMPPQGIELPDNIAVMYCPISGCAIHDVSHQNCWRRQEFVSIMKQYLKQTPHVYLYVYNPDFLTGLFVPERQTANVANNIPLYKKLGIKGFRGEGRKAWMQVWTSYYVSAKLLWDADTDVAALKKEFYRDFFGPEAGPHIQAWWDAVEKQLGDAKIHLHEDFLLNNVYTVDFSKSIQPHIEAAQKAKATDAQREKIEAVTLIADHLSAYADMEAAEMKLDYAAAAKAAGRMVDNQAKLEKIYSFFISKSFTWVKPPQHFLAEGRQFEYERLLKRVNGEKGQMVAPLPLNMKFTRDPFDEGVVNEWYAVDFDDTQWGTMNTHLTWEAQEEPLSDNGHFYDGHGWYRGEVEVPKEFDGKEITFYCGGGMNEVWLWINGQYVYHHPLKIWWMGPHKFDVDVTEFVKPGQSNTIAIRVWNKAELGGLYRRGFFWSPNEAVAEK